MLQGISPVGGDTEFQNKFPIREMLPVTINECILTIWAYILFDMKMDVTYVKPLI